MKKIAASLLTVLLAFQAIAQDVIKVSAPNLVASDEQFNVTFTIEGEDKPSSFSWDPGSDFQLVWGPQKGSSTSISIVNGKRTNSSQTSYTYVLMPKATGTFRFQTATATVKGRQITSVPTDIQVVSNGASAKQPSGQQSSGQTSSTSNQSDPSAVSSEDIYMRLFVSKSKVVVGETITATLKLYQRVNIAGFEDARFPTFNGFWSQETQAPTNIEFQRENVGDRIFNTAVLRSWTLIPQQSGEITIDPSELVCLINVRAPRNSSNSIFDSFFQDDYRTIRKRVTTPAVKVSVSKVPAGAPASFCGGVGSFKMDAVLTRDSLQAHDAASLKVTVSGKGNLSLLEAPKISFPPDFEVYDVKTTETSGSKTFEFPFIPRSHGQFTIGPVEYSYYDISAGRYVTLKSAELPLKVSRGKGDAPAQSGGQLVSAPDRKDVRNLGSDIRFISTGEPVLSVAGSMFAGSAAFWIVLALLALAGPVLYFVIKGLSERRADVAGSRNRTATKMARKRLARAGEFLSQDLCTAFYEELHKTLLGFVSDKLNMNAAELSKDNISARLRDGGASEVAAEGFVELLDACEFARYAPSEGHEAMNAHYESAVKVISDIDESMRRKHKAPVTAALAALLLTLPLSAGAAAASDSLWTAGVNAYSEGRWADAASCWEAVSASGLESPELWYNLGNAYFKQSEYARAILGYERALKLDPSYADARFNLEFANTLIQDRIESVPEFFLTTWVRKAGRSLPSTLWAVLCLVFFAGTVAMALLFLLSGRAAARKAGFFTGLALLLLTLLSLDFSLRQRSEYFAADKAVVMSPVVAVKSSPGADVSTDLFVLHEGTRVTVEDSVGEWRNVVLADGRQGWLRASDIEII